MLKKLCAVVLALGLGLGLVSASAIALDPKHIETPWLYEAPNTPLYQGPVSVAFWNIQNFTHQPNKNQSQRELDRQLTEIKRTLDRENPTILFACEIHSHAAALALNQALADPYPYVATTDFRYRNRPSREGMSCKREVVIFSRIPWVDIRELDYPLLNKDLEIGIGRGMIRATFNIQGRMTTMYAAHYKANVVRPYQGSMERGYLRNVQKREQLSRLVLHDMQTAGLNPIQDPIVLLGDFNTDIYDEEFAGEKTIVMLKQAGFYNLLDQLPQDQRITKPSSEIGREATFDFILNSVGLGQKPVTIVPVTPVGNPDIEFGTHGFASDHHMLKMTLKP